MAKAKELLECQRCFDRKVPAEEICICTSGHTFCKECVRKYHMTTTSGAKARIGDGETFPCLTDCAAEFKLPSLQVIETTRMKRHQELERSDAVVDTGDGGPHKRKKRSKDWSDRETKKFYRALHVVGTDFSLMQPLFRSRPRSEIKAKFKKEERLNPSLINQALAQPLSFDISELEKELALEEEEERRLVEENEKNSEASCSINSKDIPRGKQARKKLFKSSQKSCNQRK